MDQATNNESSGPEASNHQSPFDAFLGGSNSNEKTKTEAVQRSLEFFKSVKMGSAPSNSDIKSLVCADILANITNRASPFLRYLPPTLRYQFLQARNLQAESTPSSSHGVQAKRGENLEDVHIPDGMEVSTWLLQEAYLSRVRLDLLKRPKISSYCSIKLKNRKVQLGPIAPKLSNVMHSPKTPNLMDLEVGNVNFRVFADGTINLNSASSFAELKKAVGVCVTNLHKAGYFDGIDTTLEDLKRDCVYAMEGNALVQVSASLPWQYDFDELMRDADTTDELLGIFAYDPEYSNKMEFALNCSGKTVKGYLQPTGNFRIKSAKTIEMAQEAFVRISLLTSDYRCSPMLTD